MRSTPYREAVGALMYLRFTRPDVANALRTLSKFAHNPGLIHWQRCKRVMRYLAGTAELKLTYSFSSEPADLYAYVDASFGNDPDRRRSTTGWSIFLAGGVITWASRTQKLVTLSTSEAE